MYGNSVQVSFGMAPLAIVGLYALRQPHLIWFAMAASIPLLIVLILGVALLRQDLTEAEALDVSE